MGTPRVSGNNYLCKSAESAGGYLDATGNVMCIYTRHGDTLTVAERPLYGTKRLGELRQQIKIGVNGLLLNYHTATIGFRHYELTDHLGNVMAVVSDRKTLSTDSMYIPDVISYTDYYPFGFPMESRSWDLGDYRYGFNGQESDNEVYGEKNLLGYEFRQYDARLGRWWGVDPLAGKYPSLSPYTFCANNPVNLVDPNGKEIGGPEDPPTKYTIKKGDTFWNLENARNLPHGTLQRQNPSLDPNNLQIGTEINYPYMQGDLIVSDNSVPTGDVPECYNQPTSNGPVMDMSNYNTLSPLVNLFVLGEYGMAKLYYNSRLKPAQFSMTNYYNKKATNIKPKGWSTTSSKKMGGVIYKDPNNPHNSIRVMPENPGSPNPAQQVPYVKFMKNGRFYDVNGRVLSSGDIPQAHIPLKDYNPNVMPK